MYGGKKIDYLPFSVEDGNVEPVYETLPGWSEDLTQIKDKADFPKTFVDYINYIEEKTETPIGIVSVGPDREQTIFWKS